MTTSPMSAPIVYAAILPCAWILLQSCGGSSEAEKLDDPAGGAAGVASEAGLGGGAQGGSSNGGAANGGAAGAGGILPVDGGEDSSTPDASCTGKVQAAVPAVLDVHILLDATASMTDSGNGTSMWPGLTAALVAAISDSKNAGLGVGLTFLPNPPPAGFKIPGSCTTNADCTAGTCQSVMGLSYKACSPGCNVDSDCGSYGPCQSLMGMKFCNGVMSPSVSCDLADYGQPAVGIALLPGNQSALSNAIQGKTPDGEATPTLPALQGTLAWATTWAKNHPGHIVQVLFATDGLPTSCTGNTIPASAQIAAAAYSAVPSVPTFVLNVNAAENLDEIAKGGGTKQAAIANASTIGSAVSGLFDSIRARGACSFQVPAPDPGQSFDPNMLNLTLTEPGTSEQTIVPYVGAASSCDPASGGWYYDPAPGTATPTLINACTATCTRIHAGAAAQTMVGCHTGNGG